MRHLPIKEIVQTWMPLSKALEAEFVKRNAIAHGVPVVATTNGHDRIVLTASKHWLAGAARRNLLKLPVDAEATFFPEKVADPASERDEEIDSSILSDYARSFHEIEGRVIKLAGEILAVDRER